MVPKLGGMYSLGNRHGSMDQIRETNKHSPLTALDEALCLTKKKVLIFFLIKSSQKCVVGTQFAWRNKRKISDPSYLELCLVCL